MRANGGGCACQGFPTRGACLARARGGAGSACVAAHARALAVVGRPRRTRPAVAEWLLSHVAGARGGRCFACVTTAARSGALVSRRERSLNFVFCFLNLNGTFDFFVFSK